MTPTVEQVLAVLAHELRTPIGVAQSYLRLMRDGAASSDPGRVPLVERTREALTRLSEVTRQSDELARQLSAVGTASMQPVPIQVVAGAIEEVCAAVSIPYTAPPNDGQTLQLNVRTARTDVVAGAFSALLEGLRRERSELEVEARVERGGNGQPALRFVVASKADRAAVNGGSPRVPVPVDRGGLGLNFIGGVLLLCACGAQPWTLDGARSTAVVDFSLEG